MNIASLRPLRRALAGSAALAALLVGSAGLGAPAAVAAPTAPTGATSARIPEIQLAPAVQTHGKATVRTRSVSIPKVAVADTARRALGVTTATCTRAAATGAPSRCTVSGGDEPLQGTHTFSAYAVRSSQNRAGILFVDSRTSVPAAVLSEAQRSDVTVTGLEYDSGYTSASRPAREVAVDARHTLRSAQAHLRWYAPSSVKVSCTSGLTARSFTPARCRVTIGHRAMAASVFNANYAGSETGLLVLVHGRR